MFSSLSTQLVSRYLRIFRQKSVPKLITSIVDTEFYPMTFSNGANEISDDWYVVTCLAELATMILAPTAMVTVTTSRPPIFVL